MSAEFWRLAVLCGMYVCVFFNFCFAETPGEKNRMSGRQGELKVNVVYSSMNFWDRSKTFHRTGPHPTTHIYFWVRGRGRSDQPLLGGPDSALVLCKDRDSFDPELCNTSFEILIKNNLIWVTCLISSFKEHAGHLKSNNWWPRRRDEEDQKSLIFLLDIPLAQNRKGKQIPVISKFCFI